MPDTEQPATADQNILSWLDKAITVREQSARSALTDPSVALARCTADRQLMLLHGAPHVCPVLGASTASTCQGYAGGECDTIRLLAEGYGWTETAAETVKPWTPEFLAAYYGRPTVGW